MASNPIDQQIINVVRTCYASYLQTTKYLGLSPFRVIAHTTLNEKFGVQNGVTPAAGEIPNVRYMVIGNMGHYTIKAADGSDEVENRIHRSNHAALYNHIPFALREVTDDLPAAQRDRFCLRVPEKHNGKNYVAYYGMRINVTGVQPQLLEIEVINGIPTPKPYTPTVDDLNPVPPAISNNGTVIGSNVNISASAIVKVSLSAEDIIEITNAHRIRTASTRSPIISEIGLCSGVDRKVDAPAGTGGSFQYLEVIACQVNVHIATNHPIGYNSNGLNLTFDIGGVEPTLGDKAVNVAKFV
ncbi:hypothetical protein [Pseudomonas phage vB_PaeM_PS119XW]|uniref:Virion structural protein n=1 Tax=Pseudomonas phage vB_PaeM_PS119XW TaxID=2601632 RepID=A0A5C1K7N5_9CAUD|nr:hypothetical protein PP933_gp163 [Pseudomonas phage vB_PaeM_PS119XW]QEM41892.1 hypothetical protein [Pseudomonas phage vB_PaeM_PS119XW]BEG72407.1 hypothetical protein RVBP21_0350 [Pseudomonas phage BRkr]